MPWVKRFWNGTPAATDAPKTAMRTTPGACVSGVGFLDVFNKGKLQHTTKRMIVVGGGDTSIDVASVARRIGHIEILQPLVGRLAGGGWFVGSGLLLLQDMLVNNMDIAAGVVLGAAYLLSPLVNGAGINLGMAAGRRLSNVAALGALGGIG